jgi:hypothetical protein
VGRVEIRLFLWSSFLKKFEDFLQPFPVSLIRYLSTCYTERRQDYSGHFLLQGGLHVLYIFGKNAPECMESEVYTGEKEGVIMENPPKCRDKKKSAKS